MPVGRPIGGQRPGGQVAEARLGLVVSGVPNTLYDDPRTLLLFGDAKETVAEVLRRLG